MLETIDSLEANRACGILSVCARNTVGAYLYTRTYTARQSNNSRYARSVVEQERQRRWSLDERESFINLISELEASLPADLLADLRELRELADPLLPIFPQRGQLVPAGGGSVTQTDITVTIPQPRYPYHDVLFDDDDD
jgi:hypothetical protein